MLIDKKKGRTCPVQNAPFGVPRVTGQKKNLLALFGGTNRCLQEGRGTIYRDTQCNALLHNTPGNAPRARPCARLGVMPDALQYAMPHAVALGRALYFYRATAHEGRDAVRVQRCPLVHLRLGPKGPGAVRDNTVQRPGGGGRAAAKGVPGGHLSRDPSNATGVDPPSTEWGGSE